MRRDWLGKILDFPHMSLFFCTRILRPIVYHNLKSATLFVIEPS